MSHGARKKRADPIVVKHEGKTNVTSQPLASQTSLSGFDWRVVWISLGLIVANLVIYAPVLHYPFVTLDDETYIVYNSQIFSGLTWSNVHWAFTTGAAGNWHPLTWLSFLLDFQIYGMKSGPFHLTNLLLHIANTLLLFLFFRRITGTVGRSAFVAGLLGLHPLHVESVAWVTERKDVLSMLFLILACWAYARYVDRPSKIRYAVIAILFALGLMAKSMLVTLPFCLLLLDVWPLGRATLIPVSVADSRSESLKAWLFGWSRLVIEKLPLFALSVGCSVVTYKVQTVTVSDLPLHFRVSNALQAYVAYISKMLWPTGLAVLYPYDTLSLTIWKVGGAVLALAGVTIVAIRMVRSKPYFLIGWLWYLGTLIPVIGLVQVGVQSMADRYTYIPLIGLSVMVAWGIPDLLGKWRYRNSAILTATGIVFLAFTITAQRQVLYWEDSLVLLQHALDVTERNYMVHYALGNALAERKRWDEASAQYSEALRINPDFTPAKDNLSLLYQNSVGTAKDADTYRRAAEQGIASAQFRLGWMYANGNGVPKDAATAVSWYRKAADQGLASAQSNLGAMYEGGNGVPKDAATAVSWYRKAADQGLASAQSNLGAMYANGNGVPKDAATAVAWYRKAADQGNSDGQYNLGWMYANGNGVVKNPATAVSWYRKAADQGDAGSQASLGLMYESGNGVSSDFVAAYMWLNLAAAQGDELGKNRRNALAGRMTPSQVAEGEKLSREWKPKR